MINAETERRRSDAEISENLLSEQVLDAAIELHRSLGVSGIPSASLRLSDSALHLLKFKYLL